MSTKRHSEDRHSSGVKRRRSEDTPLPPLYYVFNGEVASVQPYGIFVKIPGSRRQGLVHKSQISKSRVDDPSEMFTKGEMVYCKVISIDTENGDRISLAMKTVNQTSGKDMDANNIELSQDEKRRKQGGFQQERKKIELEAVFDTTCKKCGTKGHLAQDCFKTKGDKTYELIPDWDEYMKTASHEKKDESTHKHKKKKKEKVRKEKKEKKKTSHSSPSSDSDSDSSPRKHKKKQRKEKKERKKKKQKRNNSSSSSSESDRDSSPRKHKKKKHHRRSYSSSDG